MIKHPFPSGTDFKKYVSGIDLNFDIKNVDSSALMAANEVKELISKAMYDKLIDAITTPPTQNADKFTEAIELLRYTMAPFILYKHFIWLQLRVSNMGVTTYKSSDETTAFGYQTDEAKESLLDQFSAYLSELIEYLEAEKTVFTDWADSDAKKELDTLLLKSHKEFDSIYKTEGGAAFFLRSRIIQKEIQNDELKQHVGAIDTNTPADVNTKLKRALVYFTLARCITEWDYMYLPAPLKRAISNEQSTKNGKEIETLKERVSTRFKSMGEEILNRIDMANEAAKQAAEVPKKDISLGTFRNKPEDKHVTML